MALARPSRNLVATSIQKLSAKKYGMVSKVMTTLDRRIARLLPQAVMRFDPIEPRVRPRTAADEIIVLFLFLSDPHSN